jgi:hypothetical protein
MLSSRGLKQVAKHFFFLLQITEMRPSMFESAKEEVEDAVPSGLKVTSADHHNQQACR